MRPVPPRVAAPRLRDLPAVRRGRTSDIVQWNCNGIGNSAVELNALLSEHKVKVAALQETKLGVRSKTPIFPNYRCIRHDRVGAGGGGLILLVHHSVQHTDIDTSFNSDPVLELQGISATINNSTLHIFNVYIPPVSSCPPGHQVNPNDISAILTFSHDDTLILGDFNAHSLAWHSSTRGHGAETRGNIIAEEINSSDLALLNEPVATYVPSNGNTSSPDISIISAHLLLSSTWSPLNRLNSDHLPISISFADDSTPQTRICRTYTNFARADWPAFTAATEERFELLREIELSATASHSAVVFTKILSRASKHHIPAGFRKDFSPGLPRDAVTLINQRDALRAANHTDPNIPALNELINESIRSHQQRTWSDTLAKSDHNSNTRHFWSTLRTLSGKSSRPAPNLPISFGNRTYSKSTAIANRFNKQFTSVLPHTSDPLMRKVLRGVRKRKLTDDGVELFSAAQVKAAIAAGGNSTAAGPDKLTILHLKHLGPLGLSFLTDVFNNSVRHASIPALWKSATIIPLLKAGKPDHLGSSYRPISLLCPAAKILERLLLPALKISLVTNPTQHGFKSLHSTTTALLPIANTIATGFNQYRPAHRSAALAIDFSKAFDSIDHAILLHKISLTSLHPNLLRWLACYLRGRVSSCLYQGALSVNRINRTGVPQGSVISPCLFNFYISDCPTPASVTSSYADDLTIVESSQSIRVIEERLRNSITPIQDWADRNKLLIEPTKSSITLFTPWTQQFHDHPSVDINNNQAPLEHAPKILGVNLDTMFTFSPHVNRIYDKATSRLQVLKALSGTSWGHQKETLLATYGAIIKPIITYCAPIWSPNASPSAISRLQTIQNSALRIATGSTKMSSFQHLHSETLTLPIVDQLELLNTQFLASALRPDHPSHTVVTSPSGPRPMKKTLQSAYIGRLTPHLNNLGQVDPDSYRPIIASIHTDIVRDSIVRLGSSKTLGRPPPMIDPSELLLPRIYRSTLSQLRSGYCSRLKSYQYRIGGADSPDCPECGSHPHTSELLFNCPSFPTDLDLSDLWARPLDVAAFLRTHVAFSDLPPLVALPPLIPPEPPPGHPV